ncbi:MAG: DUF1707 domain-containing protein [Nocardiaceae bacterium]|nr:DUF1707 domain-containing protein [Nocardiaceae bacterium]
MDARDLRVSDAERAHVGEVLQRAVGQGMITLSEFTERFDTALAARTRGELNSVLVDLPGVQLIGAAPPQPVHQPLAFPVYQHPAPMAPPVPTAPSFPEHLPGYGHDLGGVRARLTNITRRGRWFAPPTLHVNSWLSGVTLDFTSAQMSTQVVEIVVDDYLSSLVLVVPPVATVDLSNLELIGGSTKNKTRSGPPMGPLHLVVRGRTRFGSVTAKHPFGTAFRRAFGR